MNFFRHPKFSALAAIAASFATFALPAAAAAKCNAEGSSLIQSLNGNWRGGGTVTPIGADTKEPIRCNISYNGSGDKLQQNLICGGTDYRIEAISNVACTGGSIAGTWIEKIANNTGSVVGGIGGNFLNLEVSGPNFVGRFAVNFTDEKRHTVTITQFDPAKGRHVPVAVITLTR